MAAQLRLVRRRISSVQSISKITRAQELIASSRIVRAQQQQRSAEPYARELTRAVEAVISRSTNVTHPFTQEPENPSRAAVLILTSDQGTTTSGVFEMPTAEQPMVAAAMAASTWSGVSAPIRGAVTPAWPPRAAGSMSCRSGLDG